MRTLRTTILAAGAALAAGLAFGGIGATQTWVANYVSNYVERTTQAAISITTTNGATAYRSGQFSLVMESSTERALVIVGQTPASIWGGYTNGTILARVEGADLYKAGRREISFDDRNFYCRYGGEIYASQTISNRTWLARTVVTTNMDNVAISAGPRATTNTVLFCAIARTFIQPSLAAAILEEE